MSKLSSDRINEVPPTLAVNTQDGNYPAEKEKAEVEQIEGRDQDIDKEDAVHTTLIDEALAQSHEESKLGLWKMMKLYYPGLTFGLLLSLALVMEGYDLGIINNFFAQTQFLERFGQDNPETGERFIPSDWQAGINNASSAGQILGLIFNGWCSSRFGYRRTYMFGMVLMIITIFVLFFAVNLEMLLVGNILCGFPWGLFQTITTAYAAEIVPPSLRGFLTSWVSMCWGAGGFLSSGVLRGSLDLPGDTAWKLPFGLQWVWPVPLLIAAWFAPESPYYLVRKNRIDEAAGVLKRIARPGYRTDRMVEAQLELMKQANEIEKLYAANVTYWDCFRGTNLKRTEIGVMVWLTQIFNGAPMTGYTTLFLRNAGMSTTDAFNFNMGISSTNIVSTGIAMFLMGKVDRRIMYLSGIAATGVAMMACGILGAVDAGNIAVGIGACLTVAQISFKLSLGPCCYAIAAETPSSRVRPQTMVIGRSAYVVGQIIINQLMPRMINSGPGSWDWGALAGWFWMAFDIVFFVYMFFRLPETRNRTTAEIEYMFKMRVPPRKFKGYEIGAHELAHAEREEAEVAREALRRAQEA